LDIPAAPATSWGDLANVSVQVPNDVRGDGFEAYGLQRSPAGFGVKLDGSAPVQLLGPVVPKDGSPQEVGRANTFRVRVRPGPALGSARKNLRRPLSLDVTVTQIRPLIVERLKHLNDPAVMFRRFRTQVVGGVSYTIRVPPP
jgi:hypothetical protein